MQGRSRFTQKRIEVQPVVLPHHGLAVEDYASRQLRLEGGYQLGEAAREVLALSRPQRHVVIDDGQQSEAVPLGFVPRATGEAV